MRRRHFYVGMATAYASGVAAFFGGMWLADAGRGRHPVRFARLVLDNWKRRKGTTDGV